jgi:DNA-binding transcriptional LysR family regulator
LKALHPALRVSVQIETSDVLLERLAQGKLDMLVARLFERHDKTDVRYEAIAEEPVCAMVRPGHPLLAYARLGLRDLANAGWIVPPTGSVLRHRWELMFQQDGLAAPENLVETTALLFITRMLQDSDMVAVIAADVAQYYVRHGLVAVLPVELPCKMDAYGIITRSDRLLSPAAEAMLRALRSAAASHFGHAASAEAPAAAA